jgi:hypothetical protein
MLDLETMDDLELIDEGKSFSCMWKPITTKGKAPGAISDHSSVVYKNKLYIFGGNKVKELSSEDRSVFELDLSKQVWTQI